LIKVPVGNWHPLSKLTVVVGVLVLFVTWWQSPAPSNDDVAAEAGTVRTVAASTSWTEQSNEALPSRPLARPLPPLSRFEAMVQRPLFAPDRRPAPVEMPVADAVPSDWARAETMEVNAPGVRFIGSIEQNGAVRALVSDGAKVQGLEIGQSIDGWTVVGIAPRRLTLAVADQNLELTILE
jgi:hypothetical protein